jgi:hypothetical protein
MLWVGNGSNIAAAVNVSGDATITNSGVLTVSSNAITSSKISDGTITNVDIAGAAAIALSKLATGSSGQIIVGDASGVPTYATQTGDVTISNTGVTTIANNAITGPEVSTNAIDGTKISLASEASGDVMYFNGTDWIRLGIGTNGQVLQSTGSNPTWSTLTAVNVGGTTNDTLRWNGSTWVPTSSFTNDGTNTSLTGNLTQTGATTLSSGTGAVSLNGNTSVTGTGTLTVGTGATTLGGALNVSGALH